MDTSVQSKTPGLREAHLRDYWKVVWQGRWTVLAVFALVVGATAIHTFLQTPIYRSSAAVEVRPQARRLMRGQDVSGLGAAGYGWFAEEKYQNTQVEIIKSRDIARRVVDVLDLETHPRFENSKDILEAFRAGVRVAPRRDTGLIEISMLGANKDEITQWVNATAEAYVTRNFEKAQENVDRAVTAITSQLAALQGELSDAEQVRIGTLEDTELYNSENQEEMLRQKLQTYSSELTTVQIQLNQLADTLRRIGQLQREGADLLAIPEVAADEALRDLLVTKVDLERQLESAKVDLKPGHPKYEKTEGELEKVEQRVKEKIGLLLGNLRNRYDLAQQQESYLKEQVQAAEEMSLQIAKATSRYEIIKTDADVKERLFELITGTMSEVQLSAELMTNNVSILDRAVPPLFPVKPRKRMNLMLGAVCGMLLGLGAVFFLDYLDNTIRTPEDVEKFLGLSVLSVVPKIQDLEGPGQRAVREAYQSLRTSIIFSSKNRQRRLLLVTSTGPQEGKSSTVANLARTLAAAGDRVVVIDCDMRRPKQHLMHKVQREPGLTNFLAGRREDTDWAPFLQTTDTPNLQLLACGPIPPNPPELLGSDRFGTLLTSMRESFDWVIVDSPPASSLSDSTLLASTSDLVVMVIQHNRTDRDLVVKTIQQLRSVEANLAGVVLNNVDLDRTYNKDYYYAGYYYGDDGAEKKKKVPRRAKVG